MHWTKAVCVLVTAMAMRAQEPAPAVAAARPIVVLDAAHGGSDDGAKITDRIAEKSVTMDLAAKLKSLLNARGFDVRMTREGDPNPSPTPEQRAGMANQAHAIACLSLHSASVATGIHLYVSALPETRGESATANIPWDEAQSAYVGRSLQLSGEMATAFTRSNIPITAGRTWMQPLDNMLCPAVAIEMAPLGTGDDATPVTDSGYQQRVADSLAGVLLAWRNHADLPAAGAAH
jgi:N-acetylmuramoyl-L-alanine amidase